MGLSTVTRNSNLAYIDIAVDYMFAIWCEESVCHFIQTVGFNAEMFMPRAKGFLKDTKLPFKLLKLGHLPCSGNSESYLLLGTASINKQLHIRKEISRLWVKSCCCQPLTNVAKEMKRVTREG